MKLLKPKDLDRMRIAEIKIENDRMIREIVRKRDCDENGFGFCVTCGNRYSYKVLIGQMPTLHVGHWIDRACLLYRWDERNIHCQCFICNTSINKEKEKVKQSYIDYMIGMYGYEQIEHMLYRKRMLTPPDHARLTFEKLTNEIKSLQS